MTKATATAECTAALEMAEEVSEGRRVTIGGDKGYDQRKLVELLRLENVTPHVAQNEERRGGSGQPGAGKKSIGASENVGRRVAARPKAGGQNKQDNKMCSRKQLRSRHRR